MKAADHACRATDTPSGSSASIEPMQPFSSPWTFSVTNDPTGRRSAVGKLGRIGRGRRPAAEPGDDRPIGDVEQQRRPPSERSSDDSDNGEGAIPHHPVMIAGGVAGVAEIQLFDGE